MLNFNRLTITLTLTFLLGINGFGQAVNYTSGFYAADSVLFRIDTLQKKKWKKEISINCFNEQTCYVPYTRGIWIYDRNKLPNTWEDQQLVMKHKDNMSADVSSGRGLLDKVNVIHVRIKDEHGHVIFQKAYFIGLGYKKPYSLPVVHLLVDSNDVFGKHGFYGPGEGLKIGDEHFWNYLLDRSPLYNGLIARERIEKKCIVHIVAPDNTSLLYQHCGIRVSGNTSRELPNRTLAIVAREEYSGQNRFLTDLFGDGSSYKWIRFRPGGSSQYSAYSSHEIAEKLINGLKLGEVEIKPVIVFLNGSYWSLSFAQDKVQEYTIERIWGIDHDEVSIIRPCYIPLEFLPPTFFEERKMDMSDLVIANNSNGKPTLISLVEKGTAKNFMEPAKILFAAAEDTTKKLPFHIIDSLLDIRQWVTYLATIDYAGFDYLSDGIVLVSAPGRKIFPILNEGDYFGVNPVNINGLREVYPRLDGDETFTSLVFANIILKNEECLKLFILRYEDLLNTWFSPTRTVDIVNHVTKSYINEYDKHQRSWPNTNLLPLYDQKKLTYQILAFCKQRPTYSWEQISRLWKKDTYTLSDRKTVSLVMDSIPSDLISVQINSLTHTTSYTGLYYPNPALHVSLNTINLPKGSRVIWKEYPDSAPSFVISPYKNISLTPVLRQNDNPNR